jgi:hypothetical protein
VWNLDEVVEEVVVVVEERWKRSGRGVEEKERR